jgi:hypothetical protein
MPGRGISGGGGGGSGEPALKPTEWLVLLDLSAFLETGDASPRLASDACCAPVRTVAVRLLSLRWAERRAPAIGSDAAVIDTALPATSRPLLFLGLLLPPLE